MCAMTDEARETEGARRDGTSVAENYGSPAPSAIVSPFASDEELCEKLLQKAEEIIGAKFGIP